MKKGVTGLAIVLILALAVQLSMNTISFPGYGSGNCNDCHNVAMNSWVDANANAQLVLDGKSDDAVYGNTPNNAMRVPIAVGTFGGFSWEREFVNMQVSQNSTHLFIALDWADASINGTDKVSNDPADGMAFLWNIDSDWDLNFETGMKTGSGQIDTWMWKTDVADEGTEPAADTGTSGTRTTVPVGTVIDADYVMGKGGWYADDVQNVQVAGVYGNLSSHHDKNYGLEFVRPLVTNDPSDVQFNESRYYDFTLAMFNNNNGIDHHPSFMHKVWVYNPNDVHEVPEPVTVTVNNTKTLTETSGASFGYMGVFIVALVGVTSVVIRKRSA